jgi:nicotinate-nucleotide pyrophosphorylase (carboxylating)
MTSEINMNHFEYRLVDRIKRFLDEDIGYGDINSNALISESQKAKGKLYFKESGIVSGLEEAATVFKILGCRVKYHAKDGEKAETKKILLSVEGTAKALLMGERLALNLVGRMAGIATQTAIVIEDLMERNLKTRVAATRKTLPGFREFDKKAVINGGGDKHRFRLDDCVLIKDNHLELLHSITSAVNAARRGISFTKKIEVEVSNIKSAIEAIEAGAEIIMFDNMNPTDIRKNLEKLEELGLRKGILFEASGGITTNNFVEYAKTGVDIISLGSLTHSVHSLDVKFKIEMMD